MRYFIIFLTLFLTSCSLMNKDIVIKEKVLSGKRLPLPQKPKYEPYNAYKAVVKGKIYYVLPEPDARKMILNWIQYKDWAESLEKIIENYNRSIEVKNKTK